jgi:Polymer-forming cytoskeletal
VTSGKGRSLGRAATLGSWDRAGVEASTLSCIGWGMSNVGKIECNGAAEVFGRVEGELRASQLLIGEGAQVEGNVIAEEVTVRGRVKGSIRAVRVRLQAAVPLLRVTSFIGSCRSMTTLRLKDLRCGLRIQPTYCCPTKPPSHLKGTH